MSGVRGRVPKFPKEENRPQGNLRPSGADRGGLLWEESDEKREGRKKGRPIRTKTSSLLNRKYR